MSKCHLNLEDVEGRVAVMVQFAPLETGFNKDSAAHQIGLLVLKYIETELLQAVVDPEVLTTGPIGVSHVASPALKLVDGNVEAGHG